MDFSIQHYDTLDSTNKEVLRQAAHAAKEGLVVVAKAQTDGKGRLGRSWETLNESLAMSLLLRPKIKMADIPKLSLLAAVALHEALSLFSPNIGIKWPNDLLIKGEKIAGILTEMNAGPHGIVVVIGMGININPPLNGWTSDMRTPPTSLNQHCQQKVDKDAVLQAVLESLDIWYTRFLKHGFTPILDAWQEAHLANGKIVSVHDGIHYIQGIALGLAEDGRLRLLVNGKEQRIIAGDVTLMEQ